MHSENIKKQKTLIKICGMTREEDIDCVNQYGADFAGFILFFPKSKRNLELEEAGRLRRKLNKNIKSVAVTVSPTIEQVRQIEEREFDYIQIHGNLEEQVYDQIHLPILRAFNVTDMVLFDTLKTKDKIKGYVFDAKNPGSGETFDWNLLKDIKRDEKMLFLAGGIGEGNVLEAIRFIDPEGIDVSSAVEKPDIDGKCSGKDPEKVKRLVRMVHDEK